MNDRDPVDDFFARERAGLDASDPVADFFARERAAITPLPGDDTRWDDIVARAKPARRRGAGPRWLGYAAGVAAAATLAAAGGWMLRGGVGGDQLADPAGTGLPTMSSTSGGTPTSQSPTADPTAMTSTGDSTTAGQSSTDTPTDATSSSSTPNRPLPMPVNYDMLSISQAGASTIFSLGLGVCSDRPCPVVARSSDNGETWERVATMNKAEVPELSAPAPGANSFTQIRMANEKVGWIFGGGLWQTTDGGLTWHDYSHAGTNVLDVATDGTNVVFAATTGDCDGDSCEGELIAQVAAVSDGAATAVPVKVADGKVNGALATWWKGRAYVSPELNDGTGTPVAINPDGTAGVLEIGCSEGREPRIVAPGAGERLFATCNGWTDDEHVVALRTSDDNGQSWHEVPAAEPLLTSGPATVAAGDADHLIAAVSGATPRVVTSDDGGLSWREVTGLDRPAGGWRWAGAPGASWYYLTAMDGRHGFYKATGFGSEWVWNDMAP